MKIESFAIINIQKYSWKLIIFNNITFFSFYADKCIVNGHKYTSGDSFLSSDCSSKCTCNPGGKVFCIPLCTPQGSSCKLNERAVQVQEKVFNSTCTCPALKCVKNNQTLSVVGHVVTPNTQGITFYFV